MENVKYQRKEGVQLFINEELELEVRAIKNEDRSISLNAEDTAIGFGWYQIKNNKKYPKWRGLMDLLVSLEILHLWGKMITFQKVYFIYLE